MTSGSSKRWAGVWVALACVLCAPTAEAFTRQSFAIPPGWVDLSPGSLAANGQDPRVPQAVVDAVRAQSGVVATAMDIEGAADGFGDNFNAIVTSYAGGPIDAHTLDDMMTGLRDEIVRTQPNSGYHVLERNVVVLSGVHVARWVAEGTLGGTLVRQLVFAIPGGGQIAVITYSTTPDQWLHYRPIFEAAAAATSSTGEPPAHAGLLGRTLRSALIGGVVAVVASVVVGLARRRSA